jgi:thiol-disulfide isomerase/thioredoxin
MIKKNKGTIGLVLFLVLAYAIYFMLYRKPARLELDGLILETNPGIEATLGSVRDNAEVIHFYAHWCGPCLREIRTIQQHFETWSNSGVDFIFLTDDSWEQINQMKLLLPTGIRLFKIKSLNDIGVRTIPTTYVINQNNEVVFEQVDACDWQDTLFLQEIQKKLIIN